MINVQGPKITLAQTLIVLWVLLFCVFLALFYLFVFRPSETVFESVKTRDFILQKQLSWVRHLIEDVKDPGLVEAYLIREDQQLARKFPFSENKSLVMLSEYARKFQVHVEQISVGSTEAFKGSFGRPVVAEGKTCFSVLVTMKIKAGYLNLVKYLEALQKVLPAYLFVEKIDMIHAGTAQHGLNVQLELSLFLLVPK